MYTTATSCLSLRLFFSLQGSWYFSPLFFPGIRESFSRIDVVSFHNTSSGLHSAIAPGSLDMRTDPRVVWFPRCFLPRFPRAGRSCPLLQVYSHFTPLPPPTCNVLWRLMALMRRRRSSKVKSSHEMPARFVELFQSPLMAVNPSPKSGTGFFLNEPRCYRRLSSRHLFHSRLIPGRCSAASISSHLIWAKDVAEASGHQQSRASTEHQRKSRTQTCDHS